MSNPLPERALDTSAERPWPVRVLSMKIEEYVAKMSPLWVEGQIVQLTRRPGSTTCYVTLRDPEVDMSLSATVHANTLAAMGPNIAEGTRVVVHAKPTFWTKRGTLQLDVRSMRHVGVGELLARLEHLKQLLRSEGLFDASRKRSLPFLPRRVGLICGRGSAAEKDVVENAVRRWPATRFEIRRVAVQGVGTVEQVSAALAELDAMNEVDVIVIARGGGSFEDLLPFSNEALLRAVSKAVTPIVAAIGHDVDAPLLDYVADRRASTPTDAANLIVPSLTEEVARLTALRQRSAYLLRSRVVAERRHLRAVTSRPVLTRPHLMVTDRRTEVVGLSDRARTATVRRLERAASAVDHQRSQLRALSPLNTLQRGYAVVQAVDGSVVTDERQVAQGDALTVTVAQGSFRATRTS